MMGFRLRLPSILAIPNALTPLKGNVIEPKGRFTLPMDNTGYTSYGGASDPVLPYAALNFKNEIAVRLRSKVFEAIHERLAPG